VDPVDCLRRVVEWVDGPVGGLSARKRFGGGVGVEGGIRPFKTLIRRVPISRSATDDQLTETGHQAVRNSHQAVQNSHQASSNFHQPRSKVSCTSSFYI
jgi:hypothetical protein